MAPSQPGGGRGHFNAGHRRTRVERMGGGPHFTSEWVYVDNTSIKLFFLHPKPSRSRSKATPREEKRSRVQTAYEEKSCVLSLWQAHSLTHSHAHSLSDRQCYRHRKHWFLSSHSLSISISGKIWYRSAMSHRLPPRSCSPAPGEYGERERQIKKIT